MCAGVGGLIAGLVLSRVVDHAELVETVRGVQGEAPHTFAGTGTSIPAGFSVEDLRRVVREELAAHGASSTASARIAQNAPAEGAAESPSTEQMAAAVQAHAALDEAISRRQWTEADAQSLRERFHNLSDDQQVELLRKFSVAVNQGRLVPQTDGVPF